MTDCGCTNFPASLGIGTAAPQAQLHIASTTAPDSQYTAQPLLIETSGYGDNNHQFARYSDTSWSKMRLWFQRARGSKASPAPLQDEDWLGTFGFGGWTPAGWADGVNLSAVVDGTPSGGVVPGKLAPSTVDSVVGSSLAPPLSNGNIGIGTTTPGYPPDVNGTTRMTGALLGGDMLMSGALKESTGQVTHVVAGGCYYA